MTRITIPAHDSIGVRVFAAKLSPDDLQRGKARLAAELLGDPDLDPAYLELFDLSDLAGVGLSGYLVEGLGIPDHALSTRDHLDALQGPVLILLSKALHGREATLTLDPRVTLVATFAEERSPVHFQPLPSAAAHGTLTAAPPLDHTPQRPATTMVLLGLALVLIAATALWLAFG